MDTKQAKDFFVREAAEQALLDRVSLSDIEKRMIYFTESDPASCPDPISLNDEFESQYDMPAYEAKMYQLLTHAHERLRRENPERVGNWDEAIKELQKGDHYVLVLLGPTGSSSFSPDRPKHDSLKLLGTAVLVAAAMVISAFAAAKVNVDFHHMRWLLFALLILVWAVFSRSGRVPVSSLFARRKPRRRTSPDTD